jgi:hypothetical protein
MSKRWSEKRPNRSHLGNRPFGDNNECVITPANMAAVGNRFARRRAAAEARRLARKGGSGNG